MAERPTRSSFPAWAKEQLKAAGIAFEAVREQCLRLEQQMEAHQRLLYGNGGLGLRYMIHELDRDVQTLLAWRKAVQDETDRLAHTRLQVEAQVRAAEIQAQAQVTQAHAALRTERLKSRVAIALAVLSLLGTIVVSYLQKPAKPTLPGPPAPPAHEQPAKGRSS